MICLAAQALIYNSKGPINIPALVLLNNFVFAIPITALYFGLICENTRQHQDPSASREKIS